MGPHLLHDGGCDGEACAGRGACGCLHPLNVCLDQLQHGIDDWSLGSRAGRGTSGCCGLPPGRISQSGVPGPGRGGRLWLSSRSRSGREVMVTRTSTAGTLDRKEEMGLVVCEVICLCANVVPEQVGLGCLNEQQVHDLSISAGVRVKGGYHHLIVAPTTDATGPPQPAPCLAGKEDEQQLLGSF